MKQNNDLKKVNKCNASNVCGGCQYAGLDYVRQLEQKQTNIEKLLASFGPVDKIVGMENPYHYRNKVCAEFKKLKNGKLISGRYQEGTHKVIQTDNCMIENEKADEIIHSITTLFQSFKMTIYNEDKGFGLIRHVLVRTGHQTGQIMVIIVTASPVFPSKKNFAKALLKVHPEITTIVQNINTKDTSMVLGDRNQVIYGKGYIEDVLCGKRFRLSPGSFYQVNSVQTEKLYNRAVKYADLKKKETIIDAYCGIGTIGIIASAHAKKVIGVELNPDAIRDAKINSRMNQIENIEFYANDSGRFMTNLAEMNEKIDVVFMDPPRSGSDKPFLSSLIKLAPKKVVYISCGPESLARDLKYLTSKGYQVIKITPFDLFPFTEHVETVVLLGRELSENKDYETVTYQPTKHLEIKTDATYEEIKVWIWDHYNLKVSSLYVAQIKRKCGLELGENYNKPKSKGNRVPICPPEKEKAILAAFRYFYMI